jgi:hypothetical protein
MRSFEQYGEVEIGFLETRMNWTAKEQTVATKICDSRWALARVIGVALSTAFRASREHQYAQDVHVSLGVKRTELGLPSCGRPGDVDLLIIPDNGSLMLDRTIAIELKVVRPTISKPGKNSSSLGVSQAIGLLKDGFPFVGLTHVVLPELQPRHLHKLSPVKSLETDGRGQLKDTGEFVRWDPFPIVCARRQEGRIVAANIPPQLSYRVVAFLVDAMTGELNGCTEGEHKHGAANPSYSTDLLAATGKFFREHATRFRRIRWFDKH